EFLLPLGKSDVKREGRHVTVVAYSKMVGLSLRAAAKLAEEGIECQVIDLRSLRPLDLEPVYESFKQTNRCVVVEESYRTYGVGAEVAARLYEDCFDYVDAPIQRVAQKEVPLPYAANLERYALPSVDDIIRAVKETLK
ncbi:MAG: alpha-ketoacid dehydrogenase subunit beta, partial [Anaerolineales bacterium]|nr:alpha-ketoacid dehydrogenase subunit beta [Anaerolineales bacterium]